MPADVPRPEELPKADPALFSHCKEVYEQMKATATKMDIDGEELLVWEGFLTKVFRKLSLAVPYYTSVTNTLKMMGCCTQLRRGGGSTPSQWSLNKDPDLQDFFKAREALNNAPRGTGTGSQGVQNAQAIRDLAARIDQLEAFTGLKEFLHG
jgi:hypothetical protein